MSRAEAAAELRGLGWRYLLDTAATAVPVAGLPDGLTVASAAIAAITATGDRPGRELRVDQRADRCLLSVPVGNTVLLHTSDLTAVRAVTDAVLASGHRLDPSVMVGERSVQTLEVAIDAVDIPAIRPFWRAVLGYVDDPSMLDEPDCGLIDPVHQQPTVWFQQMDAPRPQRNRIHLDLTVPEDEAETRLAAAIAAGGILLSDARANAFWVLADPEGNELCICTWQDRDSVAVEVTASTAEAVGRTDANG